MNVQLLCERFGVAGPVRKAALRAEELVAPIAYEAQARVKAGMLAAFLEEGIAESDLAGSFGYGYDDAARAKYEALLARIFGAERALARLSLVSGTHAIVTAIAACVPHGRTMLSMTGRPYDTLRNAIVDAPNSLVRGGMGYKELPFDFAQGSFDKLRMTPSELEDPNVAAVFVQRSRGYAPRRSVSIGECAPVFAAIKKKRPDVVILVDNCYGESLKIASRRTPAPIWRSARSSRTSADRLRPRALTPRAAPT